MSCRSRILTALTVSLIAGTTAFAANVANEAELRAALDNVAGDPTINLTVPITLTAPLVLPDAIYTINGAGNNLTTINNLSIPDNVTVNELLIDGVITYSKNVNAGGGLAGAIINNPGPDYEIPDGAFFINNSGLAGGAIYNNNGNFIINNGAIFKNNNATAFGGAIMNTGTFLINGDVIFTDNAGGNGGAIYSQGGDITINGGALFANNETNQYGGAIHGNNNFTFKINQNATFMNNTAEFDGGAVRILSGIFTCNDGGVFRNNDAKDTGGAINANGTFGPSIITLLARTNNIEFTGNTAAGADNAIHMNNTSTLNLNTSNTNSAIFNDGISSQGNDNIIRINATNAEDANIPVDAPTTGRVYLNADMSKYGNFDGMTGNTVNLHNGILQLGPQGKFFSVANFTASAGTTLDLNNGKLDTLVLGTADINGMNLAVDADMSSGLADTINATDTITNNDITITKINIIKEGSAQTINIDPDNEFNITLTSGTAAGKVYNYNLFNNNGSISLVRGNVNPVVQSSGVSQQNAYLNVANTNNIAFNRADNVLNLMDNVKFLTGVDYDNANKVAILEGQPEYSKLYGRLEEGAVWFRPFNSLENVTIDGVEGKVDSTSYGMLLGFGSPLKRFKKGFKGMLSVYGGYGGASQEYKTINLHQNGGLVGVMGSLYKGDFFTSLTTSIGGYGVVEKLQNYGSSTYGMLTTSVASKTGYNFHLPYRTVLQLNGQAAYSFVSSNDYDNAQGTRIDTAPLHVLQVVPGVKISKHIGSWQPYLSTSVVFNALNDSAVRANDIVLPDTQIGDYIEYGAGVEKHTESGTSGFLQAMVRNGARSGINFKFGLKFPVGKREEKI